MALIRIVGTNRVSIWSATHRTPMKRPLRRASRLVVVEFVQVQVASSIVSCSQ